MNPNNLQNALAGYGYISHINIFSIRNNQMSCFYASFLNLQ